MKKTLVMVSLCFSILVQNAVMAVENSWKEYLDSGAKLIRYQEFVDKMEKVEKSGKKSDDTHFINSLYSTASRDTIQKTGKYVRAALTTWQKDQKSLPDKKEFEKIEVLLSMIWRDAILNAEESTAGKSRDIKLSAIRAVQLQMKADHQILLQMAVKVLGAKDPGYKTLLEASQKLDASLAKYK